MPHRIGTITATPELPAHRALLGEVAAFVRDDCHWKVLHQSADSLLLRTPDDAAQQFFCGLRTYENAALDIYNLCAAGFIGYLEHTPFARQPGIVENGCPAHNQRIDYWMTANDRRLVLVLRVGTPVYMCIYLGGLLPYARPSQYPYPMVCAAPLNGAAMVRFSQSGGYGDGPATPFGPYGRTSVRFQDGQWKRPALLPWSIHKAAQKMRDTAGHYLLAPAVVATERTGYGDGWGGEYYKNAWGELDGVCHISGFDNVVENTLQIAGARWLVVQDGSRTGHSDYCAVRLDP